MRTLELDIASSEPSYQAPVVQSLAAQASAPSLPAQLPNHSTGWHRAKHKGPGSLAEVQPGARPGPDLHRPLLALHRATPTRCTALASYFVSQGC